MCDEHIPADLHLKHYHPYPLCGGALAEHMTGPAAVDEDGFQWAECNF